MDVPSNPALFRKVQKFYKYCWFVGQLFESLEGINSKRDEIRLRKTRKINLLIADKKPNCRGDVGFLVKVMTGQKTTGPIVLWDQLRTFLIEIVQKSFVWVV